MWWHGNWLLKRTQKVSSGAFLFINSTLITKAAEPSRWRNVQKRQDMTLQHFNECLAKVS